MKFNRMALVLFFVMLSTLFGANRASGEPGAPVGNSGNLADCSWFRIENYSIFGTIPAICGSWTRNNNVYAVQDVSIPSFDSVPGTALQFRRDYCCDDAVRVWQIVEAPPMLRLNLSAHYLTWQNAPLAIRVFGKDSRYGISGWDLLLTVVDVQSGPGIWQFYDGSVTLERPYAFYMVEISGGVPLPIDTIGATVTGVEMSISGSAIYLPIIAGGGQ